MRLTTRVASALLALVLAGCGTSGHLAAAKAPLPATLAEVGSLDRAALIKLSSQALATAVQQGDTTTVKAFVAYADGTDPDPAASRQIAQGAVALGASATTEDVSRIAGGQARLHAAPEATGIRFPQDEGSHASAITEWWYLNGHLETADHHAYGFEFTLFKVTPLLHWAHVAVTDASGNRYSYDREFVPTREALSAPNQLAVDYAGQAIAHLADNSYRISAKAGDHPFTLSLDSKKKPLLIGGDGKIDMPEGKDSWYYSLTRLAATGTLDGQAVTGTAWMDHQWGPFWVSGLADRWDWFALQFDDNTEYNLFGFRARNGQAGARHMNESLPSGEGRVGTQFTMDRLEWWQSPLSQLFYTTKWDIGLPETGEHAELAATNQNQELMRKQTFLMDPLPIYWEGDMAATKVAADGTRVPGFAYCEHFGFPTPHGPR